MNSTSTLASPVRAAERGEPLFVRVLSWTWAVTTVVTLAAWLVAGEVWWLQPLNLTTFWWTLPPVVLAPGALLAGWRRAAALLAVPALVWLWSYGSAFLPHGGGGDYDLRVLSFNTYVNAPDESHVVDVVDRYDPDVLLLQEVFPPREESLRSRWEERYPTQVSVQSPGVGGVAVFSRFPLLDTRPIGDAAESSRSTAVVVLDVEGTPVQVVPVHLISPCPRCGTSMIERLELEGEVRTAEMASVLAALDPGTPAIVGGDFNSTERSDPYRRLVAAGFHDPQRDAGRGLGATWPADGPFGALLRIDWVLARDLEAVQASVGPAGPSDHRPVVVDLSFRER